MEDALHGCGAVRRAVAPQVRDHFAPRRECLNRMLIFGEAHASIVLETCGELVTARCGPPILRDLVEECLTE